MAGCDAVEQDDNVDDDDTHSSCSTVYTVGDISQITDDQNLDDIACVEDIEEDLSDDLTLEESEENGSVSADHSVCPGFTVVIDNIRKKK